MGSYVFADHHWHTLMELAETVVTIERKISDLPIHEAMRLRDPHGDAFAELYSYACWLHNEYKLPYYLSEGAIMADAMALALAGV